MRHFQRDYAELINKVQAVVPNSRSIILVTIPDFTVTDMGRHYSSQCMRKTLEEYNRVTRDKAVRRSVPVAKPTNICQEFVQNGKYMSPDGLHPSATEYARWAKEGKQHIVRFFNNKKQ